MQIVCSEELCRSKRSNEILAFPLVLSQRSLKGVGPCATVSHFAHSRHPVCAGLPDGFRDTGMLILVFLAAE